MNCEGHKEWKREHEHPHRLTMIEKLIEWIDITDSHFGEQTHSTPSHHVTFSSTLQSRLSLAITRLFSKQEGFGVLCMLLTVLREHRELFPCIVRPNSPKKKAWQIIHFEFDGHIRTVCDVNRQRTLRLQSRKGLFAWRVAELILLGHILNGIPFRVTFISLKYKEKVMKKTSMFFSRICFGQLGVRQCVFQIIEL